MQLPNATFELEKNQDLIRETFEQLNKDLQMSGISNQLETSPIEEAMQQTKSLIESLVEGHSTHLFQLLYRVDINQEKIRALFNGETNDACSELTKLILQREYQKVVLRRSFK